MWEWLTSTAHSSIVGASGLIVSVVGFGITIYQLWMTRRAAEAAKLASNSTTARFNTFNALRECENARQLLRNVADKVSAGQWSEALISYHPLSTSIEMLKQSNLRLDQVVLDDLAAAISKIDQNTDTLERNITGAAQRLTAGKQLAALRPIEAAVTRAYFNVERIGQ